LDIKGKVSTGQIPVIKAQAWLTVADALNAIIFGQWTKIVHHGESLVLRYTSHPRF
jgi:hypothetical protein